MEARSNIHSADIFLAMIAALAASFLGSSPGLAAQCPEQTDAVFSARASGPEIDRLRVEYSGQKNRNGKEPADLSLTLYRGKECVAQCRSTQPLVAESLDIVDFRCSSTTLSVLGSLATLRISDASLQVGSFLQGYRNYRLEQPESRMNVLSQNLRTEQKLGDTAIQVAAGPQRSSLRDNR